MIDQELLDSKYKEIEEKADEDFLEEIDKEWEKYLDSIGLHKCVNFYSHWGENGAYYVIQELIDLVNSEDKYLVFDDPSMDGSDHTVFLVFKRKN